MKILFMGTPDFAEESLKALYEAKYDIIGVVTNVDKPKGRGMKLTASPVKEYALEKNLKVYQPEKVKNNVPLPAFIIFVCTAVSAVLHIAFVKLPAFADFFNRYISSVFRTILAKLTTWFPFSLAEYIYPKKWKI